METQRILMRSLAVVVVASVIWTITDAEEKRWSLCCTAFSKVEFTDPVIGVRMQKQNLPCVMAVIIQTERGEICCDPRQPWVQEKVKQFILQRNKPKETQLISTLPPASFMSPISSMAPMSSKPSMPPKSSMPPMSSMPPKSSMPPMSPISNYCIYKK